MKRLIIDITELAYWQGKLTGVPRVINEMTMRFSETNNCIFVKWSNQFGYEEININNFSIPDNLSSDSVDSPVISRNYKYSLKTFIKRANNKSKIIRFALRPARKAVRYAQYKKLSIVTPNPGDTLLIMADWHSADPKFVGNVKELQSEKVKVIQVCYDLLPLVTPEYSGHSTDHLSKYVKETYSGSELIISISQNTKMDIEKWLTKNNLKVPRIEVIRLGEDFSTRKLNKPDNKFFSKNGGFILCVGTIEARKNHTLLYYVYKLAVNKNIELPPLVIVGRKGWQGENVHMMLKTDPQIRHKIIILDHASDEELSWLYQNCLFSIYPSFYEGWGLPIAESISYGTPCICSNTSSMPEVAGPLVTYFSPFSADECLHTIADMLKPGAVADAKKKLEKYRPTTWDETFKVVTSIIGVTK